MRTVTLMCLLIPLCSVASPCLAEHFDQLGMILEYSGCFVFSAQTDCQEPYVLDVTALPDSLLFLAVVRVTGELVYGSPACSPWDFRNFVVGATITLCQPEDLGCGILVGFPEEDYQGCLLWRSPVYGDLHADYRGYAPGDTVRVSGVINWCVMSTCMNEDGWLLNYTYSSCDETPPATTPNTWGHLKQLFR